MAAPMMIPLEASRGRPGKINLYVGKTAVKFDIPEAEAVDRLVDLIREHGKWAAPEVTASVAAR